jgi:hypothetical protein
VPRFFDRHGLRHTGVERSYIFVTNIHRLGTVSLKIADSPAGRSDQLLFRSIMADCGFSNKAGDE